MTKHRFKLAASLLLSFGVLAQETRDEGGAIELYQAPRMEDPVTPRYPDSAAREGREGWVMLSFMVDPEGQPYEIRVIERAGEEMFVGAARRALESTAFIPARVGDQQVDGSATLTYRFVMEDGAAGASSRFASRYRRFITTLEERSQAEAAEQLRRLTDDDVHNNYEYAYLSLAKYYFAVRYGTSMEQMQHLTNALGENVYRPEYESFLPPDIARSARHALFQLNLQNRYLQEAVDLWRMMQLRRDDEGLTLFREAYEQLRAFRLNDEPYGVDGRLDERGSWLVQLFKDSFYFDGVTGRVAELKLRCERDYVFFAFDPETRYEISKRAGRCSLEVIGDPDTAFTLVQE